jgi:hypothetical protein
VVPDGCRYRIDFVIGQDGHLAEGAGVVRDAEEGLVRKWSAVGTDLDEVHVNDLIEGLILSGNFFSFLDLSLLQEVRQFRFLSVLDFEVVFDHGVSQSV